MEGAPDVTCTLADSELRELFQGKGKITARLETLRSAVGGSTDGENGIDSIGRVRRVWIVEIFF